MVGDIILIAPAMMGMLCHCDETHEPRALLVPHSSDHKAGLTLVARLSTSPPPDRTTVQRSQTIQFT